MNNTEITEVSVETGKILRTFGVKINDTNVDERINDDFDEDIIYSFALSSNNLHLASSHRSGLLRLWSIETGKIIKLWKSQHKGPVVKLAFTLCNQIICSSGADSTLRFWDYAQSRCNGVIRNYPGPAELLYFQNKTLYIAGTDYNIYAWDYESKKLLCQLRGHISPVTGIIFVNEEYLVSVGRDKVLIIWNLSTNTQYKVIPLFEELVAVCSWGNFQTEANDLEFLVAANTGNLKIISGDKVKINTLEDNVTNGIKQLLFCKESKKLAVITIENNILVYDVQIKPNLGLKCIKHLIGFIDEVLDMCLLGEEERYLAVASNSNDIKLYDTQKNMDCKIINGHTNTVLSLCGAIVKNKHFLLSAGKDYSLILWQLESEIGELKLLTKHLNAHTSSIGATAFSSDILASAAQDGSLKVWTFTHKDAKIILKYAVAEHDKEINSVAFSPNNKLIATASQDKTAKLWNTQINECLGTLRGHKRGVWCVRFSPVDQVILTASADCSLRLWSVTSLSCLKRFEHDCALLRVEFLDMGKYILSSSTDGLLKVWNIKTNDCMQTLSSHEERVWSLAVSSRSKKYFYSGGGDSQIIKWLDTTDENRQTAIEQKQAEVEQEQQLQILLQERKNLKTAFKLALHLRKPKTTLKITSQLVQNNDIESIKTLVASLNNEERSRLFEHVKAWNTNSRNAKIANVLLQELLVDLIVEYDKQDSDLNTSHLVEVMLPYVERHFNRVSELSNQIAFLEYIIDCM